MDLQFVAENARRDPIINEQSLHAQECCHPDPMAARHHAYRHDGCIVAFPVLGISHPPSGATSLIVSLGLIAKPRERVIIEVAVFLLVAQALVINRLAGLPYPLWTGPASAKPAE